MAVDKYLKFFNPLRDIAVVTNFVGIIHNWVSEFQWYSLDGDSVQEK